MENKIESLSVRVESKGTRHAFACGPIRITIRQTRSERGEIRNLRGRLRVV
jgi:hypothetical protein